MIAVLLACAVTSTQKVDLRGDGNAFALESLKCPEDTTGLRLRDPAGKELLFIDAVDGLQRYRSRDRDYIMFSTEGPHGGVPAIYGWVGGKVAELQWPDFGEIARAAHLARDREIRDRAMALEARGGKLYFLCRAWKHDEPMASDTIGVAARVEPDPARGVLRVISARRVKD